MARRIRGQGSIYEKKKNGETYYNAQIYVGKDYNDKFIRKTFSSKSKAEVLDWLRKMKTEYNEMEDIRGSDASLGSFLNGWLYGYKKISLKPNTFARYASLVDTKVKPHKISKKLIRFIELKDMQQFFMELLNKGEGLENLKYLKRVLSGAFNHGMRNKVVTYNPVAGVELPRAIKTEADNCLKTYSKEEQNKIIEYLDLDNIADLAIYIAFASGLRQGELLGLQWKDFKDGTISVTKQWSYIKNYDHGEWSYGYQLTSVKKSASIRNVPLPKKVARVLEKRRQGDDEFIFKDKNKNTPVGKTRLPKRLEKIENDLGIPHRSLHSTRHSYATRLFENGADPKTVQSLLGHASPEITMQIYTHVLQDKKSQTVNLIDDIF